MNNHDHNHMRRAALIMVHHARRDQDGVNEVIRQVRDDDDPGQSTTALLFAVLDIFQGVVPMLHTETGIRLLSATVLAMAGMETDKPTEETP